MKLKLSSALAIILAWVSFAVSAAQLGQYGVVVNIPQDGDTNHFLNGAGALSTPPGSGGGSALTNTMFGAPPANGLLVRYSADSLSGTDATIITNWPDISGNGYNATGAASGTNPGPQLFNNVIGNHKGMRFIGNGETSPLNNIMLLPTNLTVQASSVSFFFITRRFLPGQACLIAFGGAGFGGNLQYRMEATPSMNYWYPVVNGATFNTGGINPRLPASVVLHGVIIYTNELAATSGRSIHVINSSVVNGSAGTSATQIFSGGFLGSNGLDSYDFAGDLFECLVYDHALSDYELMQVQQWAYANYPIHASASDQVMCFGDSITAGGGSDTGHRINAPYPHVLANYLGWQYETYNFGGSGAWITNIFSTFSQCSNLVYQPNRASSIVVLQGGVNDLINAQTGAATYSNYVFLAKAAKATGAYVLACTTTYHGGGGVTEADNFNALIRTNMLFDTGIDGIVDLQADARLASNLNTNYSHDAVHYSELGCKVFGELVGAAIAARISTPASLRLTGGTMSGVPIIQLTNLLATAPPGIVLSNPTPSTASATVQSSPYIYWSGGAWLTTPTSNAPVVFRMGLLPVAGTTAPTGALRIDSSLNGAAFFNLFTIDQVGTINMSNGSTLNGGLLVQALNNGYLGWASGSLMHSAANGAIDFLNNGASARATLQANQPQITKSANYTNAAALDSGQRYSNFAATAAETNQLPTAVALQHYWFHVDTNFVYSIKAASTDQIRWGSTLSAAGGDMWSSQIGSEVHLYCSRAPVWNVDTAQGAWTLVAPRVGNSVLVGGTVTVANTTVTANTIVLISRKTAGGTVGAGGYNYTTTAGTGFTINSEDLAGVLSTLDTSTLSWRLEEIPN